MSQSLSQVYLHLVFSTKHRQPFLHDGGFRTKVHAYLAGICNNLGCPALQIGGVEDHVHILCRFGREIGIAKLIRELKRDSSKWVKGQKQQMESFYWQNGYGAFSLSPSHVEALRLYIQTQEEHHRKASFQDEFRRLLTKYGMDWDERYVWD